MARRRKIPEGVIVDLRNPRRAMMDAGWAGDVAADDLPVLRRKRRTKRAGWIERVLKSGGGLGGAGVVLAMIAGGVYLWRRYRPAPPPSS